MAEPIDVLAVAVGRLEEARSCWRNTAYMQASEAASLQREYARAVVSAASEDVEAAQAVAALIGREGNRL